MDIQTYFFVYFYVYYFFGFTKWGFIQEFK